MDLDARHSFLREKLDTLGFTQPLPYGSLAIVSAILDDLIVTTNNLKKSKKQILQLNEEKTAWELGVEPYKCDNSKLLAECNSLHLEMIKQRDSFEEKITQLNKTIRNLKLDRHYLDEQCSELSNRIIKYEELLGDPKYKKSRNDQVNQRRKPFISTVRSGEFLPSSLKLLDGHENESVTCSKCSTNTIRSECSQLEAEREKNKVKTQLELIELYKSQLESRNREINRLNGLLIGGRPPTALAKDCCYRGVGSLTTDIEALQKQKSKLQLDVEESIRTQHEAMERAIYLQEKNQKLSNELDELKEVALSVETEANSTLETLHKRNTQLKAKHDESKKYIRELENKLKHLHDGSLEKVSMKKAIKEAKLEIRFLQDKLERVTKEGEDSRTLIERLTKKNTKLKNRFNAFDKTESNVNTNSKDVATTTSFPYLSLNDNSTDISRLKVDRDFYQQEYLKLISRPNSDVEVERLRCQLNEKEFEIKMLRQQISPSTHESVHRCDTAMTNRSVQSAMNRLEREKNVLEENVNRLTSERNEIRQNLHLATATQRDQITRHEHQIEQLTQTIRRLENENRDLQSIQMPSKTTINLLKDELSQLRSQLSQFQDENSKLRTSYNQLKIVQEQTENALVEHQNRLTHSARQLNHAESRLTMVDSSRSQVCHEIGELKAEINRLKLVNTSLEKEKDRLIMDLDSKTEKLFKLESSMDSSRTLIMELESQVTNTNRQLESINTAKKKNEGSLQQATSEVDAYRRQINQLKRANDNALAENSRLTNELAEMECNHCLAKTKLSESEKEVDRLKSQLQQYVQEVERAEELLLHKEEERGEMLEHYRTLSHDAVLLEGTNHSLEIEAAEAKRSLIDADSKIMQLESALNRREKELNASNDKVCELTKQVNKLELEVDQYKHEKNTLRKELDAIKELCSKLDIEKDKLNAELVEYSEIRRELERENEKCRSEILMSQTGDKAAVESLQQLLQASRKELDDQRVNASRNSKEITNLRNRIDELQEQLRTEHANAVRQETLAKEYTLQVQELRNRLTDSQFNDVRRNLDQSTDRFSSF